jgi:hypothetical protein
MTQPIIEKSYLVEVNVGTVSAQKQINFQFVPQLEGATIYAIQTFSSTDLSVSPNGGTVTSLLGLAECTVTFAVGDTQDIFLLPCTDLRSPTIFGFQRMFANKKLNLTKSFVTINSIVSIANNNVILFNFIYRK